MKPREERETAGIVVPVFNRAHIVARTLQSIKGQTYRPLHLVLVDNNSSDESLRVISEWADSNRTDGFKITVASEKAPGACAARNRGLSLLDTGKVLFFDSDDTMNPDLIEKSMHVFSSNPTADIVFWRYNLSFLDGAESTSHFTRNGFLEYHLIHGLLSTQAYMARKELFIRAGSWNESLRVWNDYELGLRLLLLNPVCIGIDAPLAKVFRQKDSITGTSFSAKQGLWEESLGKCLEDLSSASVDSKTRESIRRALLYRFAILAAHYRREGNLKGAHETLGSIFHEKGSGLTPFHKRLLKCAYRYTAAGGRGAWYFCRPFLCRRQDFRIRT